MSMAPAIARSCSLEIPNDSTAIEVRPSVGSLHARCQHISLRPQVAQPEHDLVEAAKRDLSAPELAPRIVAEIGGERGPGAPRHVRDDGLGESARHAPRSIFLGARYVVRARLRL